MTNQLTNATAGAALVAPWWLPQLQTISEISSIALPILGAVWLVVQIVEKLRNILKSPKR